MTRDSLANAIRWHYEDIRDAQLKDALISLCDASKQLPPIKEFDSSTAERGQEVAPEVYEMCIRDRPVCAKWGARDLPQV